MRLFDRIELLDELSSAYERAGRVEDALTAMRTDVWLYNNAGLEYGAAGDHDRALGWLTDGLELALATADPEQLVDQLLRLRRESLTALGLPRDGLDAHAEDFLTQLRPHDSRGPLLPAALTAPLASAPVPAPTRAAGDQVTLAVGWFPRDRPGRGGRAASARSCRSPPGSCAPGATTATWIPAPRARVPGTRPSVPAPAGPS